jgi:hypothetical protein
MRFWRLEHPDYDNDYTHSYVNGSLEHPFGLPGFIVRCVIRLREEVEFFHFSALPHCAATKASKTDGEW